MRKKINIGLLLIMLMLGNMAATAQCAMCTKTASQLGEKPALGLNSGIIYLMLIPFGIMGFLGYRWWKSEKAGEVDEQQSPL
jgi:hypothetical protein